MVHNAPHVWQGFLAPQRGDDITCVIGASTDAAPRAEEPRRRADNSPVMSRVSVSAAGASVRGECAAQRPGCRSSGREHASAVLSLYDSWGVTW
jgi:hypothetical protein